MKLNLYVAVLAVILASMAPTTTADNPTTLTVAPGETLILTGTVTADTITVHGTILAVGDLTLSADAIHLTDTARVVALDGKPGQLIVADSAAAQDGGDGASLRFTARVLSIMDGAHVQSGSGGAGGNALGTSFALGGTGGDIHLHAQTAHVDAVLLPGAGGDGGHAVTTGTIEAGPAHGGSGGASGMVYLNGKTLLQGIPDVPAPQTASNTLDKDAIHGAINSELLGECQPGECPLDRVVGIITDPCGVSDLELCTVPPLPVDCQGIDCIPIDCEGNDCADEYAGPVVRFVENIRDTPPPTPTVDSITDYLDSLDLDSLPNALNDVLNANPSCLNAHGRDGTDNMLGDGGDGGHGCTEHQGEDGDNGAKGRDDPVGCTDGGPGGHGNGGQTGPSSGGHGGDGTRNGGHGGSALSQAYGGRGGNGGNGGQSHVGPDCQGGHGGNGGNAISGAATGGNGGQGACGTGGNGGSGNSLAQGGAGGSGGAGNPAGVAGLPGTGSAGPGTAGVKGGTGAPVCP